ncbi:MAG: alpha/beta fold hydrolase [Luteolibacter sp.]
MSLRRSDSPPFPIRSRRSMVLPWHALCATALSLLPACAPHNASKKIQPIQGSAPKGTQPTFLNDPLERANRGVWVVNKGLMLGVIQPTGRAYRTVVPQDVRTSITKFGRNATYPGRAINLTLQGRWQGLGDETWRFLTNSTAGIGGFFDPATRVQIPKADANFAQTFSGWGWKPQTYLMLPLIGPSDEMHGTGKVADELSEPWNYYSPFQYASYATTYNDTAASAEEAARFMRSDADPYANLRYVWTYASKENAPDWSTYGPKDPATLQTLGVTGVSLKDPEFIRSGKEMSVSLATTGKKLKFNCWIQKQPSPLVFINPGLGSHRLSLMTIVLAESLYRQGYSVVTTTSVFHPEFMEHASTSPIPAYTPRDSRDLHVALTEMGKKLDAKYPGRFPSKNLVGCSMGAYLAMYLAAHESSTDLLRFDRYVAINPPVTIRYGIAKLDQFQHGPLSWPADVRQPRIDNTIHKVAKLSTLPPSAQAELPFDKVESQFLIGMTFRLTLRDVIFSSQYRHNMGVLRTPLTKWNRDAAYDEIFNLSYRDYFESFVLPYYRTQGITLKDFDRVGSLKHFGPRLRRNSKIRVITNANDFLLAPGDVGWLKSTVGSSRVTVFPAGGHMGNIGTEPVHQALLKALR